MRCRRLAVDDRGVVVHRPRRAELGARAVHRQAVVRRVEHVLLTRHAVGAVGQVDDAQHALLLHVVLDEAVEERQLQVDVALVGRDGHRPHRGAEAGVAGLLHLLAHVPALQDREARVVDDLEELVALADVDDRLERRGVERRVDAADARVEDLRAVLGVVVLVRAVAGGELARLLPGHDVQLVDHVRGRVRDDDALAVRRDAHVVRAVARDREAPEDLARRDLDPDDVGEARPRHGEDLPVVGREHVVGELIVALADPVTDRQEERELVGVRVDLGHPLGEVGNDVDPAQALVGLGIDDAGRAVPVVADEHHVAQRRRGRLG